MAFDDIRVGNHENLGKKMQLLINMNPNNRPDTIAELTDFFNDTITVEREDGETEEIGSADVDFNGVVDDIRFEQPDNPRTLIINLPHPESNREAQVTAEAADEEPDNPNHSPFTDDPWYPVPKFYFGADSLFWKNEHPTPMNENEKARQMRVAEYCMNRCK